MNDFGGGGINNFAAREREYAPEAPDERREQETAMTPETLAAQPEVELATTSPETSVEAEASTSPEQLSEPEQLGMSPEEEAAQVAESREVVANAGNKSLEEVQKYTEAALKPTLTTFERRLNESGYPFYKQKEAAQSSHGSTKQSASWAGLSVARLYRHEARLARYGLSSENLRAS